jgi:hypothetical protein
MTDESRIPANDQPEPTAPAYEPPSAEDVVGDDPVVTAALVAVVS